MLERMLEVERMGLVLRGQFNPSITQPFWLSSKNLIREEEAASAKLDIIHEEIVQFELDWVKVMVTNQRFELSSNKSPYFEPVKDLFSGIFKILKETPVKSLGINSIYDLKFQSKDAYYEFGDRLCPLNNWSDFLEDPRLFNLEIIEKGSDQNFLNRKRVKISPTDQDILHGVSFNINDHFEEPDGTSVEKMLQKLQSNWESSRSKSRKIVENLIKLS